MQFWRLAIHRRDPPFFARPRLNSALEFVAIRKSLCFKSLQVRQNTGQTREPPAARKRFDCRKRVRRMHFAARGK
jgi:hypothetical protein